MKAPPKLKDTLSLPRTNFSMRANLPQREPGWLKRWEAGNLYEERRRVREGAPLFVLHDGPPYANDDIHLGTAINKILKDLVVKSKSMLGFDTPFVPGWDCHGLPIELKVEKKLGSKKKDLDPLQIRQACREHAQKFVERHREDFKRLGCLGRWQNPYRTMSNQYEHIIADTFLTFLERGNVYKGLRPVLWCWHDRTALAEAEIEYEDRTSPSIWVRYEVAGGEKPDGFPENVSAVIWTTTPWTLPASLALAFHPQLRYTVVESAAGELYLVADDLVERFSKECGIEVAGQKGEWTGAQLEGLQFQHPFLDRTVRSVLADYVTLEQGSGVVHTAPGHGADDFYTGKKYGIEAYCPVDEAGRITEGPEDYKGKKIFDANAPIVELLKSRNALVGYQEIEHSYPHCWRCHKPLIFRATEQWFISLEANGLRQQALEEIGKVTWTPAWGGKRIGEMIGNRPDWCISRQRIWGVPIAVVYCEGCGEQFTDVPALRQAIERFKQEGADAWYKYPAEELLPAGTKCAKCGHTKFRKEMDILDVWFDSGSSHLAVLDGTEGNRWPADVYLEGNDQYRGWFHSSMLIAVGAKGGAPYRGVVTHGWVLDGEGKPMSKSLGNVIAPREIWEKYGAEILRLVTASIDYHADMRISPGLLEQSAEAYRKVRNTFRYCLGNLEDFDPQKDAVAFDQMEEIDRWALAKTARLVESCRTAYDSYAFYRVWHQVFNFCVVDLSATYFDILKDRLYTFGAKSKARRSGQTALYTIAHALARLLAPILSFTTEEVWEELPNDSSKGSKPESVHLALLPEAKELGEGLPDKQMAAWGTLIEVREQVLKGLETARQAKIIGSSLEAEVRLKASGGVAALLETYEGQLCSLFIVSAVGLGSEQGGAFTATELPGLEVAIGKAPGEKCQRCWNYSEQVTDFAAFPGSPKICERCAPVLEEILAG